VTHRNPAPTVDIIIELSDRECASEADRTERPIILIERKNTPFGWAIPGGFIDYGESAETAAIREAKEEVSLDVELVEQFQVYSEPDRDPRQHTLAIVFIAKATGTPQAADDAKNIGIFHSWEIPTSLCFDHDRIIEDYWRYCHYGIRPHY
jgi:8-oxo-dGTP diphosphatase